MFVSICFAKTVDCRLIEVSYTGSYCKINMIKLISDTNTTNSDMRLVKDVREVILHKTIRKLLKVTKNEIKIKRNVNYKFRENMVSCEVVYS